MDLSGSETEGVSTLWAHHVRLQLLQLFKGCHSWGPYYPGLTLCKGSWDLPLHHSSLPKTLLSLWQNVVTWGRHVVWWIDHGLSV